MLVVQFAQRLDEARVVGVNHRGCYLLRHSHWAGKRLAHADTERNGSGLEVKREWNDDSKVHTQVPRGPVGLAILNRKARC